MEPNEQPTPRVPIKRKQRLTEQQRKFCENYMSMGVFTNLEKAARDAGYAELRSAGAIFKLPQVQEYLDHLRFEARQRTNISIDDVIRETAKIAFFDIRRLVDKNGKFIPLQDLDDITAAAIKSIKVDQDFDPLVDEIQNGKSTVEIHDKIVALKMLQELLGYKNNQIMTIKRDANGKVIETQQQIEGGAGQHEVIFTDNSKEQFIQDVEIIPDDE